MWDAWWIWAGRSVSVVLLCGDMSGEVVCSMLTLEHVYNFCIVCIAFIVHSHILLNTSCAFCFHLNISANTFVFHISTLFYSIWNSKTYFILLIHVFHSFTCEFHTLESILEFRSITFMYHNMCSILA